MNMDIEEFYNELKENTEKLLKGLTVERVIFPENSGKPIYAETVTVVARLPKYFTTENQETHIVLLFSLDELTRPVRDRLRTETNITADGGVI